MPSDFGPVEGVFSLQRTANTSDAKATSAMSRGDRDAAIVRGDEERRLFLETLEESCSKTGWSIHAYALPGLPCHGLPETPPTPPTAAPPRLSRTSNARSRPVE